LIIEGVSFERSLLKVEAQKFTVNMNLSTSCENPLKF